MYFYTIGEALNQSSVVVLPTPSNQINNQKMIRRNNGQQPIQQQQKVNPVQQSGQTVQIKNQQQVQPQNSVPVGNRLNAVAMNKRQIPNGSKNTVNPLRQAQQPLNIRK